MKKLIFVFINFVILSSINAQPTIEWVRRFNYSDTLSDYFTDMKLDKAGNIYIAGKVIGNTSNSLLTVKYNSKGDFQWARTYNCSGGGDEAVGLVVDTLGNVYVTGRSDTLMPNSNIRPSIFTIKYSTNGDVLWMKRFLNPDTIHPTCIPNNLCIDDSLNIYIIGTGYRNNSYDYIIIKYNKDGEFKWVRYYDCANSSDAPWCVTYKNNFIFISGSTDTAYGNTLKYDRKGNRIWISNFNGLGKNIFVDDSNYIYIGGAGRINNYQSFRTSKYDSSGALLWTKIYQDTNWTGSSNYFRDMYINNKGNVYTTGWGRHDAWANNYTTIKYNSEGDSLWTRIYHNNYGPYHPSDDLAESIVADNCGNVYVAGSTDSNFIFYKFCTVKYDSSGIINWIAKYPVTLEFTSYYAKIIKLDSAGNIYIVGESIGNGTGNDIIILKYSATTGIKNISTEIPKDTRLFQNYPNPFNQITSIKYQISKSVKSQTSCLWQVKINVFDILGKEIFTLVNEKQSPGTYETRFDCGSLATGIYFYSILINGKIIDTKKLVLIK
jgi:hypothetical protein